MLYIVVVVTIKVFVCFVQLCYSVILPSLIFRLYSSSWTFISHNLSCTVKPTSYQDTSRSNPRKLSCSLWVVPLFPPCSHISAVTNYGPYEKLHSFIPLIAPIGLYVLSCYPGLSTIPRSPWLSHSACCFHGLLFNHKGAVDYTMSHVRS
jgi:hypothetical protein